jgi:outer membrane lipoprotein-sorting protein
MTLSVRTLRAAIVATSFLMSMVVMLPGHAQALSAKNSEAVDHVSKFFNRFKTMTGEFVQIGPRGGISKGMFYISKPGKLRFDYLKPNPFLIVSDGTWVVIKNRKNNRMDHYPLSATPLNLILSKNVNLRKNARILGVKTEGNAIILTLAAKSKAVPGKLTLIYDKTNETLKEWVVIDGENRRTSISLVSIDGGVRLNPKLFVVRKQRRDEQQDSSR